MPLLRGIARTAAIAGTATAVSNRVRVGKGIGGHNKTSSSTRNNKVRPSAAAGTSPRPRSHRTAEGPRRTQVSGHPHRSRIRDAEGEDPWLLNRSQFRGAAYGGRIETTN